MVRLGPGPIVLTRPAGTRGKWEMPTWSRGVRSAALPSGPSRAPGFGCVTFLSGRHESDTGPIGRGCYWA
jgi:hypothetical protein